MRILVLAAIPMLARACGGEADATVAVPAPTIAIAANAAAVPVAKHGGTVVVVDDVQMELIVKGDGEVVAYPVQASPSVAPTLTADAQVTVAVPVQSGRPRPTRLVWNPTEARFVGRVQGAAVVTAQPADVEVTVVSRGRRRHHRVEHVVVAPAPTVIVEHRAPTVVVERPAAQVVVQRPATQVVVQRPAAHVVVERPAAHVVVQRPVLDVHVGGGVVIDDHHHGHGHGHGRGHGHHRGHGRGHGHGHHDD